MACIDELNPEVLLRGASFAECRALVEKRCREVYYVDPGYAIFDTHLIGVPPIAVGVEEDAYIILLYTKPCYGTFLIRVPGGEEVERLRRKGRRRP